MFRKAHVLVASLAFCGLLAARGAEAQGFGYIDTPKDGQVVSGVVTVSGWAVDFRTVDKVELFVDGVFVNRADLSLPRTDVFTLFPQYSLSPNPNPGWITSFLARLFTNGPHSVSVKVTLSDQSSFTLGPLTVTVNNSIGQAPLGFIDVPGPKSFAGASGSFPVLGWAIDDVSVDHVDFKVDGGIVATAIGHGLPGSTALYGFARPDVRTAYPDVPSSLYSGFIANIDTTHFIGGVHTLEVRATDNTGANASLGTRSIQIVNNQGNLGPFGWLDFPNDSASLLCSFTPGPGTPSPPPSLPPAALLNFASGWALSTGTRPGMGSVVWVELLLDGAVISNTTRDCFLSNGKLTNCYGLNRPDLPRVFPGYLNGDNAGYTFAFTFFQDDPSGLLSIQIPTPDPLKPFAVVGFTRPGKHTLSIRAGSDEGQALQIASISVDVLCDSTVANQPAFGYIDTPKLDEFITSVYLFSGWAYDLQGVLRVEVALDGPVVCRSDNGTATYGVLRPDVPAADRRVPTAYVGWTCLLDTTKMGDGLHEVAVYVWDNPSSPSISQRTEIGRVRFVVNNNVRTLQ
ncbi:MAG TPA: Ig-like domain-containing protein [Thermoanaerobaculia bacterium]|nr:Ig-like domain-containing protein [Thermoanaerobaculia bacterium]